MFLFLTCKPNISMGSALSNVKQSHISGITQKIIENKFKAKWRTCHVGGLAPVSPTLSNLNEGYMLAHVQADCDLTTDL